MVTEAEQHKKKDVETSGGSSLSFVIDSELRTGEIGVGVPFLDELLIAHQHWHVSA